MPQPGRAWEESSLAYRYGFNGMETDSEVKGERGNHYTTYFRQYDPRVGRWWSNDPVVHPWESPYVSFHANPAFFSDPLGNDPPVGGEDPCTGCPTSEPTGTTIEPGDAETSGSWIVVWDEANGGNVWTRTGPQVTVTGEPPMWQSLAQLGIGPETRLPMPYSPLSGTMSNQADFSSQHQVLYSTPQEYAHQQSSWPMGGENVPDIGLLPPTWHEYQAMVNPPSDIGDQMFFALIELVPIVGDVMDLARAIKALKEGEILEAGGYLIFIIPYSDLLKAPRLVKRLDRLSDERKVVIGFFEESEEAVKKRPEDFLEEAQRIRKEGEAARGGPFLIDAQAMYVPKTLQTGGHTINESTRKALNLTKDEAKNAMERLKKSIGQKPNDHGHKILDNGDVLDAHSGELLGNLYDYLK